MTFRRTLRGLLLAAACLSPCLAAGQDGPGPRPVPDDFVLPGPPPTSAPAPAPTPAPGIAPGVVPGARPVESAPAGRGVTSSGGSLAPGQSTVVGPAGTVQNPMAYARAPQAGRTDWPCVQRRIETIEPAQVWPGPPLGAVAETPRSPQMRAVLADLALRRVPLAEAKAKAKAFLEAQPEPERRGAATALFADLFQRLNGERSQVMRGIERYGARQKALAEAIRRENAELSRLRAEPSPSAAGLQEAVERVAWDTRIFNERRQSLTFVCEVPTLIEQRLFALGRTLAAGL